MGVHTTQDMNLQRIGVHTTNGSIGRGSMLTPPGGPLESSPRPPTRAALVVAMSCDSSSLSGVFQGAGNFIAVNGGENHGSSTYGLNQAIIETVRTIVSANGELNKATLDRIVTNSQNVIRNSPQENHDDEDDTVILNPAMVPPMPYERFPPRRP